MADITVVVEAVRAEARKWFKLSDRMRPVAATTEGLGLDASAFFIGDANVALHHRVYSSYQEFMAGALRGAVEEFDQIGTVLLKIADSYDRAEAVAELNLQKTWTK